MNKNTAGIRKDFIFNESNEMKESEVSSDPLIQFDIWFNEALKIDPMQSNAMFLATCSKAGKPSVRTVLLKGYDEKGFTFYTNYSSRKGNDLKENPNASLLFYWKESERQIRIDGVTEQVSKEESDLYFHSRPLESQIAALASQQSSVIESREELMKKFNELKELYKDKNTPLPDFWGGYRLIPESMEFWQGRQNRLHDRLLYTRSEAGWEISRLAP